MHGESVQSAPCSPLRSHGASDESLHLLSLSFLPHKAGLIVPVTLRECHLFVRQKKNTPSSTTVRTPGRNEFNKFCVSI